MISYKCNIAQIKSYHINFFIYNKIVINLVYLTLLLVKYIF